MFEDVPTREIEFTYLDVLVLTVRPALPDLNPLFGAAAMAYIHPLALAAQLPADHPRHLTEERATEALAKCYGMGCMAGSSTAELDNYTPAEWEAWLLDHPDEFDELRAICETRTNFVTDEDVQRHLDKAEQVERDHVSDRLLGDG